MSSAPDALAGKNMLDLRDAAGKPLIQRVDDAHGIKALRLKRLQKLKSSMPFTPFHFGPGALAQAVAPRHVSFLAFCAANVLIDTEPLYFMLSSQEPLHRFFHTYVGATLAIFLLALRAAARIRLPDVLGWQGLTRRQVLGGAVAGSYSHIVLDSIMHADIRPFSPFSQANGLYGLISIEALQMLCVACGVLAMVFLGAREWLRTRNTG